MAAEKVLLTAAATQSLRGRHSEDQSFADEVFVLSPQRVSAPPLLLIGGMGPQVGLRGFAAACECFGSSRKIVLVQACSVPDRSVAVRVELAGEPHAAATRGQVVTALNAAVDLAWQVAGEPETATLVVLCNTAHHFIKDMRIPAQTRLINLVDTAARHCRDMSDVIVLSTFGTRAAGLYSHSLARWNVRCLTPSEDAEALLMDIVYRGVKAGNLDYAATRLPALLEALAQWAPQADGMICGCTERPLLLQHAPGITPRWPLIDPLNCVMSELQQARFSIDLRS